MLIVVNCFGQILSVFEWRLLVLIDPAMDGGTSPGYRDPSGDLSTVVIATAPVSG